MWESAWSLVVSRRRIEVACFIVIMGFTLAPSLAQGCSSQIIEFTYYTDSTYTEECGYRTITCNCNAGGHGCRTPYYTVMTWDCYAYAASSELKSENVDQSRIESEVLVPSSSTCSVGARSKYEFEVVSQD